VAPYTGLSEDLWLDRTKGLIEQHPLKATELKQVVLQAWNDIFDSKLGPKGFQIGRQIFRDPKSWGFSCMS